MSNNKEDNIVYTITDPITNEVRYVGKTMQGEQRFRDHLKKSSLKHNSHKNQWLKTILVQNLKPIFSVVEAFTDPNDLYEAEKRWVKHYKDLGCNLTNLTEGGDGTHGYKHSEDSLNVMSQKRKEWHANLSEPFVPVNKKNNVVVDGVESRHCSKCNEIKPVTNFRWNKQRSTYASYCRPCYAQVNREFKKENPPNYSKCTPEERDRLKREGSIKGAQMSKSPERRALAAQQRSKAVIGTHTITGEVVEYPSQIAAEEFGFQHSNISQAIKLNKPYKKYVWKFKV